LALVENIFWVLGEEIENGRPSVINLVIAFIFDDFRIALWIIRMHFYFLVSALWEMWRPQHYHIKRRCESARQKFATGGQRQVKMFRRTASGKADAFEVQ
jgi:hypothetical protein